mgnify:CR=1 FL=1
MDARIPFRSHLRVYFLFPVSHSDERAWIFDLPTKEETVLQSNFQLDVFIQRKGCKSRGYRELRRGDIRARENGRQFWL